MNSGRPNCLGLLLVPSGGFVPSSAAAVATLRSGSTASTAQPSIDLIRVEGCRSKVIAKPFTNVLVLGMIFLLKCFKQLGKPRRSPGIFRWTLSLSRDTYLSKRFVSEQHVFEDKFVLPAVGKIVLV
jgi:hypothetical protein